MILVTKISGAQYYVNPDLIEYIEEVPGTILCLTNGKHLNILEPPEVVIDRIVTYRRRIYGPGALPETRFSAI